MFEIFNSIIPIFTAVVPIFDSIVPIFNEFKKKLNLSSNESKISSILQRWVLLFREKYTYN